MFGYIAGLSLLAGAVLLAQKDPCPPKLEIGQSYHEIQSGPCPGVDSVASFKAADSVHVGYRCRSQNLMLIGDIRTGKLDAIFLYAPE